MRDFAHDDRGEEGSTEQGHIRCRHAQATFLRKVHYTEPTIRLASTYMHEIKVSYACIDKSLKGGQADTLKDTSSKEAVETSGAGSSPSATDDDEERPEQIEVSLAPYSCRGYKYKARDSNAKEMVAGEQCTLRE